MSKIADVNKGQNRLSQEANKHLFLSILFTIPTILYFIAFSQGFHFDGILHLFSIIPAAIGSIFWRKYTALVLG